MTEYSNDSWERLGKAVRLRREKLRLSQRSIAERAQMSPTTWGDLEAGHAKQGMTLRAVASALGWTPESPELVLEGGEAVLEPSALQAVGDAARRSARDVAAEIVMQGRRRLDDLSDEELLALRGAIDERLGREEQ